MSIKNEEKCEKNNCYKKLDKFVNIVYIGTEGLNVIFLFFIYLPIEAETCVSAKSL